MGLMSPFLNCFVASSSSSAKVSDYGEGQGFHHSKTASSSSEKPKSKPSSSKVPIVVSYFPGWQKLSHSRIPALITRYGKANGNPRNPQGDGYPSPRINGDGDGDGDRGTRSKVSEVGQQGTQHPLILPPKTQTTTTHAQQQQSSTLSQLSLTNHTHTSPSIHHNLITGAPIAAPELRSPHRRRLREGHVPTYVYTLGSRFLSRRNGFEECRIDSLGLNSSKSLNFLAIESIRPSSEPIRFWAGTQA
ncbi:hypothetical protein PIB30_062545 [Stylosanthes scabra]|uniref:Uncharacterized protein n=1 Tax=Stylosanthes scabra TaxID=79078 RepID=A0ABU6UP48_9FABA|nr:hypothetical protein [Stylosanthes scabra]